MDTPRDLLPRSLILQHEAFTKLLNGSLLNAPVGDNIGRALDVGTGCGIWAADLAVNNLNAEVIAIDPPAQTDEPPGAPEHKSKVIEWNELRLQAASKIGVDHGIAGQLPELLSETGFINVHTQDLKWPIGPWMDDERMKDIGNGCLELLRLAMTGLSVELLANIGMAEDRVEEFVEQVKTELGVGKIYGPVRTMWARKPR
ncbi:hypothetical protein MMC25_007071 [Agyrium rufum]|nr:hypothetical protein [Agyrium rufum]